MLRYPILVGVLLLAGCQLLPDIAHQPTVHNPFPQLSRVAVAPFFNLTDDPTLNVERFSLAYFGELQSVPGFEVIPVGVVQREMQAQNIVLNSPRAVQRLARSLGADAVVIGAVTDYLPYYPPRVGLQVKWFAANPGFHPIPPGYGLPWGTPAEEMIPAPLVFEAEMALAKKQLKTQTPEYDPQTEAGSAAEAEEGSSAEEASGTPLEAERVAFNSVAEQAPGGTAGASDTTAQSGMDFQFPPGLPHDWPDPRGFIPPPPSPRPPTCWPSEAPVMEHTRSYNGNDMEFTEALGSYYFFRDDARFGGWQSYLERSDDFIRFCCHMHIWEMLSARGGAGETRVVWRWPTIR